MKYISLLAVLIVGSAARVLEKRSQNIPIGYRVVKPEEANSYIQSGNKIIWKDFQSKLLPQLGKGLYLTPDFARYKTGDQSYYDCAILTDQTAWNNINKVVVPLTNEACDELYWRGGDPYRPGYVQAETGGDISTTVLISDIHLISYQATQFLIPPQLLTSGALTLYVQCAQKGSDAHAALGAAYGPYGYDPINWQDWENLHFAPAYEDQPPE